MSAIPIQRIRIWSGALRLCHWLLAAALLTALLTGWMPGHEAQRTAATSRDLHLTAGYLLGLTLVLRVVLLFTGRAPTDRWRDCLPLTRPHWLGMRDMLIFYASLGRAHLPGYYGHNPLWGPVYLLMFGVLTGAVATGLVLASVDPALRLSLATTPYWLGYTLPEWHAGLALVLTGFAALHVASVFLHDARGTASEISAMVHGHKIFLLPRSPQDLTRPIRIVRPDRNSE